jgi:molybdate transport system substrate-binding protein
MRIAVLSAGAARSLVDALQPAFSAETSADIDGSFGAVGMMESRFRRGDACDVLILTDVLIRSLAAEGTVTAGSAAPLGIVRTGLAVRHGEPSPDVSTPGALRSSLLAARHLYLPDPGSSTAGAHFVKVLRQLGIYGEVVANLRPSPNGAAAMAQLAGSAEPGGIGCTQVTEILDADGLTLLGVLPGDLGLSTLYTAAVSASAAQPDLARQLVTLLTTSGTRQIREASGFEL